MVGVSKEWYEVMEIGCEKDSKKLVLLNTTKKFRVRALDCISYALRSITNALHRPLISHIEF